MDQTIRFIRSSKRKREPESKGKNKESEYDVPFPLQGVYGQNPTDRANREAWVEVVKARCEVASLNDGCRWKLWNRWAYSFEDSFNSYKAAVPNRPVTKRLNGGWHGVGAPSPFPIQEYRCIMGGFKCPVMKQVQRCLDDMSVLITWYHGTHNHPLPTPMASTAVSDETSSFTQSSLPLPYQPYHGSYLIKWSSHPPNIRCINPNDPSKGIVLDLTSNSHNPPQFQMDNTPVRCQNQNQAPKIPVVEDPNKEGIVFPALHR